MRADEYKGKGNDGQKDPSDDEDGSEEEDEKLVDPAADDQKDAEEKSDDAGYQIDGEVLEEKLDVKPGAGSGGFVDAVERADQRAQKEGNGKKMVSEPLKIPPELIKFADRGPEIPPDIIDGEKHTCII